MKNFNIIAEEKLRNDHVSNYTQDDVQNLADSLRMQYYGYIDTIDEFWATHMAWAALIEDLLDNGASRDIMTMAHDIRDIEENTSVMAIRKAKDDLRGRCSVIFS